MATNDEKSINDAQASSNFILAQLAPLDLISSKKMFGGHGIFHEARMFGMISKTGEIFFKANETNVEDYEHANAKKHHKMPYYTIPEQVMENQAELILWAEKSILASKKKK